MAAMQKTRVYEQILQDIIVCRIAPGARLEEGDLARQYRAGLAGVRDALGRLALEGLVLRKKRAGTTVSGLDMEEIRQAFEARNLIEPHCAALAAINALPSEVEALASAVASAEAAATLGDLPKLVMTKQLIRALVGEMSRNQTLANILLPLQLKTARFWIYSMAQNRLEDRLAEIRHYHAIADGIAQRNPARASEAMSALLARFPEDLKRAFSPASVESWGNRVPLHNGMR